MKSIQTIAGELLLYFYWLHRTNPTLLHDEMIEFQVRHFSDNTHDSSPVLTDKLIPQPFLDLKDYSDVDLYAALKYLYDKNLIRYSLGHTNVHDYFSKIELTANGVDIIEGIEKGDSERKQFNITFNFNITNNTTIESLLKAELGSLFKASFL